MAPHGAARPRMALRDPAWPVWPCMALHGPTWPVWPRMALRGPTWRCMASHGAARPRMALHRTAVLREAPLGPSPLLKQRLYVRVIERMLALRTRQSASARQFRRRMPSRERARSHGLWERPGSGTSLRGRGGSRAVTRHTKRAPDHLNRRYMERHGFGLCPLASSKNLHPAAAGKMTRKVPPPAERQQRRAAGWSGLDSALHAHTHTQNSTRKQPHLHTRVSSQISHTRTGLPEKRDSRTPPLYPLPLRRTHSARHQALERPTAIGEPLQPVQAHERSVGEGAGTGVRAGAGLANAADADSCQRARNSPVSVPVWFTSAASGLELAGDARTRKQRRTATPKAIAQARPPLQRAAAADPAGALASSTQ
eukprot:353449-Chlamydomonas_euryale.AAC.7